MGTDTETQYGRRDPSLMMWQEYKLEVSIGSFPSDIWNPKEEREERLHDGEEE